MQWLFFMFMKSMIFILFISIIEILLGNTVVFYKLDALRSLVVPHEQTNVTTQALVDALYSCKSIVATFFFVALCSPRTMMPKATYRWKERTVTKSTYEKRPAQQKTRYSFCYATL
jgi:hypothetical protein